MAEDSNSATGEEPARKESHEQASAGKTTRFPDGNLGDADQRRRSSWLRGLTYFFRSSRGYGTRTAKPEPGRHLDALISDAKAVVHYAVRQGQKVSDDNIETLTLAIEAYGTDKWTEKTEVDFLKAFRRMNEALHPFSVDSIKATISPSGGSSIAMRAVVSYTFWTLVILILLISIQIYWKVGLDTTTRIVSLKSELTKIEATIKDLNNQSGFFSVNAQERKEQITLLLYGLGDAIDFEIDSESPTKIADRQAQLRDKISDGIERAAAPVFDRIDQLSSEREVFLEKSDEILLQVEDKVRVYEGILEEISARFVLLEAWALDWSLLLHWVPTFMELSESEQQQLRNVNSEELSLSTATLTLQTLSAYILPLLYGLLGACAHILRTLTKQIQRVTFSEDSLVAFRLRWPLGMLAGISVGWFFGPETLPAGLSALQPLALAFLAGYSVELLFTAMDKLVGVLDTTGRPAPDAAAGRPRARRSASA